MTDGTNHFLAVALYFDGASYAINSFVLKWNAGLTPRVFSFAFSRRGSGKNSTVR